MKPFQLPEHGFPIHFLRNCCFGKIQCHLERKGDLQCPSSPLPSTGDTTAALEFTISSLGAALPHFRAPHIIALKMQHTRDAPLTSSHRPPKTPRAPAWNRTQGCPAPTYLPARQAVTRLPVPSQPDGRVFREELVDILHGDLTHIYINGALCRVGEAAGGEELLWSWGSTLLHPCPPSPAPKFFSPAPAKTIRKCC